MKEHIQHILVLGLLLVSTALSAKVIYVNNAYTGSTKDGTSWTTPFTELNAAVQAAAEGDELWIAKGTYNSVPDADGVGIKLSKSLSFYGGFEGLITETSLTDRDWENNVTTFTSINGSSKGRMFYIIEDQLELLIDGVEVVDVSWLLFSSSNVETYFSVIKNTHIHHITGITFKKGSALFDNVEIDHISSYMKSFDGIVMESFTMINSNVHDNNISFFRVDIESNDVFISNTSFVNNDAKGWSIILLRESVQTGTIENCSFSGNKAFSVISSENNLNCINTSFVNNTGRVLRVESNTGNHKVVLKGIQVEDNVGTQLSLKVGDVNINNLRVKNGTGVLEFDTDKLSITNSVIEDNNVPTGLIRFNKRGSVSFSNVEVLNNTVGIVMQGSSDDVLLEECTFQDNNISFQGIEMDISNILLMDQCQVLSNIMSSTTNELISVTGTGSFTLNNSVFKSNTGELLESSNSKIVIKNSIFTLNEFSGHLLSFNKPVLFENVSFEDNKFNEFARSIVFTSSGIYKNVSFINNIGSTSWWEAGLIRDYGAAQLEGLIITGNVLSSNTKNGRFIRLGNNSSILNSFIVGNEYNFDSKGFGSTKNSFIQNVTRIENTVIANNKSNKSHDFISSVSIVKNSLFYNNTGSDNFQNTFQASNFYNTIIWNNNIPNLNFGTGEVKFSNIQIPVSGEGNLSVDPQFVDPQNGDFRLSCTSPLLNKGSNQYAPAGTDPNGVPRISGGVVDMGAYEFDGDPAVVNALPVPDFSLAGTSCQAKGLTFTNTTPNKSYFKYNWNFGDQSPLSSEEDPAHTYTQDGTYAVEMTATNGCGKSVTKTKDVTVVPSAVPTIEHATTICSKDTVTFTTPVSCTNRNWSVTEGTILSGQNTNQIKVAFGEGITQNGAVKLNATNCGGNVACEFPLEVEIPIIPTSIDVVGDLVACPSTAITYKIKNQKTIAGLLYTWSVTGGTITSDKAEGYNLQEVEVTWDDTTTAGTLTVATTYELIEECVATVTKNITVKSRFTINAVSAFCGNSAKQLSTDKGTDFTWTMESAGGTTINATGLVTAANTPGVYKVWATANQPTLYCNATDTVSITINEKPTLDGIVGETVVDTISNYTYTPIHSYGDEGGMNWSVNGGQQISSSDEQLIAKFNQIEPFSVTGTYRTAAFCSSDPVTLNLTKDLVFKIAGPTSGCVGDEVVFSLNNDTETGLTYSWTFDGQEAGLTASTGTIKLTGSGNKVLQATITKGAKIYKAAKTVNVQALISALALKGNTVIESAGGGTYEYIVNNPDNLTLDIQIEGEVSHTFTKDSVLTVTWNTTGPYKIEVIGEQAGQTCKTVPKTLVITKAQSLSATITQSTSSNLCLNENTLYTFNPDQHTENVAWSISGGGTITKSSARSATVNWSSIPGTYTLTVNYDRFGAQVITKQIIINPLPNPTIADATVCGELQTPLSTIQNYSTYSWSKESDDTEFSTLASPSIVKSGHYKVNVTDANGCKGVTSKFIDFVPLPNAEILNPAKYGLCETDDMYTGTLQSAINGVGYSYQWYEEGQLLPNETADKLSVSIDRNIVGTHTYGLKITSGVCEQNAPNTSIIVFSESSSRCDGSNNGNNTCTENVNFTVNSSCQPFSITNTSSQTSGFKWNFGDGTSSTLVSPEAKSYTTAGVKEITLVNGCARKTIFVEVPVQAIFTVQDVVCEQQAVTFTDLSLSIASSSITSWQWDFGDNSPNVTYTTERKTINHTYTTNGTYNVTLTVSGENSDGVACNHAYSLPLKVNTIPTTTIEVVEPGCNDNLFSFGPSNTSLLRYSWDLSGGKTSSALTPSLRYTTYGSKTIQLTVKDATECSNTISTTITVTEPVSPSPITTPVGEDLYICEGETLTLTSPLSTGTYKWYKDGEQITGTSRTLEADAGGVYSAEYATSGCTLQSETITIGSFDPQVTIEPEGALCLGSQGKLTVTPSSAYTVNWKKDNTLLTTQGTTLLINELTTSNNGDYVAILTEKQTGCIVNTTPFTLTGGTIPTSPSLTSLSRGVCYEGGTKVYPSIAINTELTKKWSNNNSDLGISTDTLTLANLVQDHNIQLEVIDEASGCAAISSVLGVSVRKKESISLSSPNQLCEYKSLSIKTNKSGADFDFEWYREGVKTSLGGASAEISTVAVADSGDYYVVATSKYPISGCVITSDTTNVKIVGGPDYPIISGDTTFCEGESVTLSTTLTNNFVWNTTDTGKELKVYQAGTYNITVTDPETGCASRTSQKITEYPLPNLGFVGTGTYERCVTNPIEFDGLASFPYYQWKRNGENVGKENTAAFPRLSGKYTVEAKTAEGCTAESDTLRITSTFCGACEVVTASDDIGVGSLRDAINCANAQEGLSLIVFKIPGDGEHIIQLDSALPVIKGGVVINGFSQTKEGVYNIKLQANTYTGTGFEFAFGSEGSDVTGMDIKGFDKGIYFGSNAEETHIISNKIEAKKVGIEFSNGGTDGLIKKNTLTTSSTLAKAIVLAKANATTVEANTITGFSEAIIALEADEVEVKENTITTTTRGVNAIAIGGDENKTTSNNISNYANGIYVATGPSNTLSQNILTNNTQAIDVEIGANGDKTVPTIVTNILDGNNYIVSGTAEEGDVVELFLNDNTAQHTVSYINKGVTNASLVWEISIPKAEAEAFAHKYVVATATDANGNTSELSGIYQLILVSDVSCTVTNTNDTGAGSLRNAITQANAGFCTLIDFKISAGSDVDTIKVKSRLPTITKSVTIDGTTESGYTEAVGPRVVLKYDSVVNTVLPPFGGEYPIPTGYPAFVFKNNGNNRILGLGFEQFLGPWEFINKSNFNKIEGCDINKDWYGGCELVGDYTTINNCNFHNNLELYYRVKNSYGIQKQDTLINLKGDGIIFTNNFVDSNQVDKYRGVAVHIESINAQIKDNHIFDNHYYEQGGGYSNQKFLAALSLKVTNSLILDNTLNELVNTIVVGKLNTIRSNIFYGADTALVVSGDNNKIIENEFQDFGFCRIRGNDNLVLKNKSYASGFFVNGRPLHGITIYENSLRNKLLQNEFYGLEDMTITEIDPIHFTDNTSNNNKTAPTNISVSSFTNTSLSIVGEAEAGDTVEVYRNHGDQTKYNLNYVGFAVANTDGDWVYNVNSPDFHNDSTHNAFYFTATDTDGNTSMFSEPLEVDINCTVTNTNDSGTGSLRQAITNANNGFCPVIDFNISPNSNAADTIKLVTQLPNITKDSITIDGSTESGYTEGSPVVQISGEKINSNLKSGFTIGGVDYIYIKSIQINEFNRGINLAGNLGGSNYFTLENSSIIKCLDYGVYQTPYTNSQKGIKLINNYFGTDLNGSNLSGTSTFAINLASDSSLIEGNVIGFGNRGVHLAGDISGYGRGHIVRNNYLGVSKTNENIGQFGPSIFLTGTNGVVIENNHIGFSNNSAFIDVGTIDTEIKNNYIGTNAAGDSLPNTKGLVIRSSGVIIEGNTIGYNTSGGIELTADANSTFIRNNYIGTNATGDEMPNGSNALLVASDNNRIFDNTIVASNIGLQVVSANNFIKGNYFGTNASGKTFSTINPPYVILGGANNNFEGNTVVGSNYAGVSVNTVTNLLSKNIIFNNGNPSGSGRRAIVSTFRDKPAITADDFTSGLVLSGTALAGDSVEVFLSENKDQHALAYIGSATAVGGIWSLAIPVQYYDATKNNYYVATARNTVDNSTSELSDRYKVGNFPEACIVTNVQDVGDGSFRDAVASANAGNCNQIHFDIPGNGTKEIVLDRWISITSPNGIEIDGRTQPTGDSIVLVGSFVEMNHKKQAVVNGLTFKSGNPFWLRSDSVTLSNCVFDKTQLNAYIYGSNQKSLIVKNSTFIGVSRSVNARNVSSVSILDNKFINCSIPLDLNYLNDFEVRRNEGIQMEDQGFWIHNSNNGILDSNITNSKSGTGITLNDVNVIEISNHQHISGRTGINFFNVDSLSIKNVSIRDVTGYGITVTRYGGTYIKIDSSEIINADRGMYLDMTNSSITNCVIDSCTSYGIRFFNNQGGVINSTISNNRITNFGKSGIWIGQGHGNTFSNNVIGNGTGAGFETTRSFSGEITNNYIGVDKDGTSLPIVGDGMYLFSVNGPISDVLIKGNSIQNLDSLNNTYSGQGINIDAATDCQIDSNQIFGVNNRNNAIRIGRLSYQNTFNKNVIKGYAQGINLADREFNRISQNIFLNENKSLTEKYINLNGIANNNKQVSIIVNYALSGTDYVISGTAIKKDTVELFLNDSLPQHALEYLFTSVADADGNWSVRIPEATFNTYTEEWFVATATDTLGNTSELSAPYRVEEPSCRVVNTNDDGKGSLRKAINFANRGFCKVIDFKISDGVEVDTIKLITDLPRLTKDNITIDGTTESGYVQGKPVVWLKTDKSVNPVFPFTIENNNITINGLGFERCEIGVYLGSTARSQKNTTVQNSVFKNNNSSIWSTEGVGTSYREGLKIESNIFEGNNYGIIISKNDSVEIKNNVIKDQGIKVVASKVVSIIDNKITSKGVFNNATNSTYGLDLGLSTNCLVKGNTFTSNTSGGVLIKSSKNTLSENIFINNIKAIDLAGIGNNNKQAPKNIVASTVNRSFGGTAVSGDKIEIFTNDGRKATNALKYIGFATVGSNDEWTFTIPDEDYDDTKNNYYVATATDTDGNTSELSKVIRVGDKPIFCYVTSVADTGVGTFRRAVDCINDAGLNKSLGAKVIFELESGRNEIPVLNAGFTIENEFGVEIDATGFDIALVDRNNNLPFAFNWSVSGVKVNKLELNDFDKGFELAEASNTIISNTTFKGVDIAIENTKSTNVTLSGNTVENATTALKLNTISSSTVSGNTFRKVGLAIENAKSTNFVVTQNTIEGGTNGITLEGMHNLTIRNNSIEVTGQGIVIDTVETLIFKDNQKLKSETGVVVDIKNASLLTISGNTLAGGTKGFVLTNSEDGIFIGNKLDSVTQKGIELITTAGIRFERNTANGLADLAQVIDLNYEEAAESNKGIQPPTFGLATYRNKRLILKGTTESLEGRIELYISDSIGADLISYVETTTADAFGNFEFQLDVEPTKINDNHYRAIVTVGQAYLDDSSESLYSSEATPTFYPNLKVCFVESDSDEDVKGTLRYNVGLANKLECNLMLFNIDENNPGSHTVELKTALPKLITNNLTIDATYQPGYDSSLPAITIDTQDETIDNVFFVNTDTTSFALHGIKIDGFEAPLHLERANTIENTSSHFVNYRVNAVTVSEDLNAPVDINTGQYIGIDTIDYSFHISKGTFTLRDNIIKGGTRSTLYVTGDTARIIGNTLLQEAVVDFAAIESYGTDSIYIRGNIIKDYSLAILSKQDVNAVIFSNKIGDLNGESTVSKGIGVVVDSCYYCTVSGNKIAEVDTSIVVSHTDHLVLSGNKSYSPKQVGLYLLHSDSTDINSNDVQSLQIGIQLDSSMYTLLESNRIYNHDSVGVLIDSVSTGTQLTRNTIGTPSRIEEYSSTEGVGILVYSSGNRIGGGHDSLANDISYNKEGGIYVMGSEKNTITNNHFITNDQEFIGGPYIYKAITLVDTGNVGINSPSIGSYSEVVANKQYDLSGTANANDTIHVYYSDGYYQNALQLLGKGVAGSDGSWTVIIDTANFIKPIIDRTLTVVATATDKDGNTSEFSELAYIGTCFLASNLDNSNNLYPQPHTLRQTIECANRLPAKDSIVNVIGQEGDGLDVVLTKQMKTLEPKVGLVMDLINHDEGGKPLTVLSGSNSNSNKLFLEIADSTSDIYLANLEVYNYRQALALNTDSIYLRTVGLYDIKEQGITIKKKAIAYTLDSVLFIGSDDRLSTYLTLGDSTSFIKLRQNNVTYAKAGIVANYADSLIIKTTTIEDPEEGITISNSTLLLEGNTIEVDSLNAYALSLDSIRGDIRENSISMKHLGNPIVISNSDSLVFISNTIQMDSADASVKLSNITGGLIEGNTFNTDQSISFVNCDSILVLENEVSKQGELVAFDLESSNQVKISRNIVKMRDTASIIDLHLGDASKVSNGLQMTPVIDTFLVELIGDCTDSNHTSIYLYGQSEPRDSIELFISDTNLTTFSEFVITGVADEKGAWSIKVPKEVYSRLVNFQYSFIVTGTDSLWNTSQESLPYRFDSVVNSLDVLSLLDEGANTLRKAVEGINCSDIHTEVNFKLSGSSPYEIVLEDTMPVINAWRGYTIKAQETQSDFLYSEDTTLTLPIENEIIVNGAAIDTLPIFKLTTPDTSSWGQIEGITFKNMDQVFEIEGERDKLKQIKILHENDGLKAVVFNGATKTEMSEFDISGYAVGMEINRGGNHTIESNTYQELNIAVHITENSGGSTIGSNKIINVDSIGILLDHLGSVNYIDNNVFGTDHQGFNKSGIVVDSANNQVISKNHFPFGNATLVDTTIAFITIADYSNGNQVLGNRIGMDTGAVVHGNSNMIGVLVKPLFSSKPLLNNVINNNEIIGMDHVPAIIVSNVNGGSVSGNYLGVDSIYKQKGDDQYTYNNVTGIKDTTALVIDSVNTLSVVGNDIINYGDYGIDVRKSIGILIDKNVILSETTENKAIQLNLGTDLESNNGIVAGVIDTNIIISEDRIELVGRSPYPNTKMVIYEGHSSALSDEGVDTSRQSLGFVTEVTTLGDGSWTAMVPTRQFGFTKFNKYLVQTKLLGNSSEYSSLYTLKSTLCIFNQIEDIRLTKELYEPCPESNFTIDGQLGNVNYEWIASENEFPTIETQFTQIDTSANVLLRISDDVSDCKVEEEFVVNYKAKAKQPEFIVSSNTFVGDTIVIIDISKQDVDEGSVYDWSSSDGITVVEPETGGKLGDDGRLYPTGRSVQIIAPEEGPYTVTQRSVRGGCFVSVEKTIDVTYSDPDEDNPYALTADFKTLLVYPSPSSAGEDITVNFTTTDFDPVSIALISPDGIVMYEAEYEGSKFFEVVISQDTIASFSGNTISTLNAGIYILRLSTKTTILTERVSITN